MNVHYFSPGPSSLPQEVKESIFSEVSDTFGIGVSVLEISHRSEIYENLSKKILEDAQRVFQVPPTHKVVLVPFGAQQHFSLVISHLSLVGEKIAYTDTGIWANLACADAFASKRSVQLIFNGKEANYKSLGNPQTWQVDPEAKYVHLTVNNTVYGTEYETIPTFGQVPLVLDMTSALGARTDIPWDQTAIVYASAQKNFGIAGVSVVIVREDILQKSEAICKQNLLGNAFQYASYFKAKSALNTPPVFAIFVLGKMLSWIEAQGGILEMESRAKMKAGLIYSHFDDDFYFGHAQRNYRSRHNFVFKLRSKELEDLFIDEAKKENILEIRGYRVLGGIRASAYNGISVASTLHLSDFMADFKRRKA